MQCRGRVHVFDEGGVPMTEPDKQATGAATTAVAA